MRFVPYILTIAAAATAQMLLATGVGMVPPPPRLGQTTQAMQQHRQQCTAWRDALRPERERDLTLGTQALGRRLAEGNADPARDAAQAAQSGDFRLVFAQGPFTHPQPMGGQCRALPLAGHPFGRALGFVSDVPGSCSTFSGPGGCSLEKSFFSYGTAFNQALFGDPRYPHGDICRATKEWRPSLLDPDPVNFGFPDLVPTNNPHDLFEAARRGTPVAVARLVAADPAAIDRPDPFGLTALAWAVIRQRGDVAEQLLSAGADPIGHSCSSVEDAEAPLRLALRTGQDRLATRMLDAETRRGLLPWPRTLSVAASLGGATRWLTTILREPHEPFLLDGDLFPSKKLPPASLKLLNDYYQAPCWAGKLPADTAVRVLTADRGSEPSPIPYRISLRRIIVDMKPSTPMLLVLSATAATEWHIKRARGARLAGIIILGQEPPMVTGDIEGVRIHIQIDRERDCSFATPPRDAFGLGKDEYVRGLAQKLGVAPHSIRLEHAN